MKKLKRVGWLDMLIYRLFVWRWNKLLTVRPDLRELFISWLKAYDMVDEGQNIKITTTVSIEDAGDEYF